MNLFAKLTVLVARLGLTGCNALAIRIGLTSQPPKLITFEAKLHRCLRMSFLDFEKVLALLCSLETGGCNIRWMRGLVCGYQQFMLMVTALKLASTLTVCAEGSTHPFKGNEF